MINKGESFRKGTKNFCSANTAANKEDDGRSVVIWHIVISLASGIVIGILLSHIVSCSRRRWFRNRKPERNPNHNQLKLIQLTKSLILQK